MLPLNPVPATPDIEPLNIGAGRRTLAISLAVLIPALLLLMLLSFRAEPEKKREQFSLVTLDATEIAKESPEPDSLEPKQAEERPKPQPSTTPQPLPEPAAPQPPQAAPPMPAPPLPAPSAPPAPANPRIGVRISNGAVYGPPNTGGAASSPDTERVGTAPNGEPLYAAAWYREPSDDDLRGYLSTASGPGWGLIACRTAPDYRVEDCVGLDEYPNGSQIMRAVLAAAWNFRVRPPRIGGKSQVGAWVRIRIDYGRARR
ncbi:protein TonB [Sphingopyxis panaciterrae]|uniref:hypothetical protein n=1 Tax=Sphingopyxis panaciterrae TaxID=363841 RepID=UPI0014242A08|nr:hypothetical protein [Sphingopyxis panaciterrae]NIJ35454.1 protein TonB [Sphingopyxis panaciterrae]